MAKSTSAHFRIWQQMYGVARSRHVRQYARRRPRPIGRALGRLPARKPISHALHTFKRLVGRLVADHLGTEGGIHSLSPYGKRPQPRQTPADDPRQQTGEATHRQTNKPWTGNPEKDQLPPDRPDLDLEKWQESNTH